MQDDILPKTLQESILAVLIFDGPHGAAIAVQIKAEEFDAPYVDLARKVIGYRGQYNQAPGVVHTDDLFAEELRDGKRGFGLRKILTGLYSLHEGLNPPFVVDRVGHFKRRQDLKRAIFRAGERYQQGGEAAVQDIETILSAALRERAGVLGPGTFMSEDRALRFLPEDPDEDEGLSFGIPELDRLRIRLRRKQMLLYIAPKGTGKSWFCVHMGYQGHMAGERVLHITLEMPEEDVLERYHQRWYHAAWDDEFEEVTFKKEKNSKGRWETFAFGMRNRNAQLNFRSPGVRERLRKLRADWGLRLDRLLIKEFPSGTLTLEQFDAYLEYLEHYVKFEPTLVIVDYPDLMKVPSRDYLLQLGALFVGLRGRASKRNFALVTPTQSGRAGIGAKRVGSNMVAQSIEKVHTADMVFTYARTAAEERMNTGRLHVSHARKAQGGVTVLLAQAYAVGQYVVRSGLVGNEYWEFVKKQKHKDDEDENGEEDDG